MTALQARLLAARSVRAAQAQETFARRLRPTGGTVAEIPAQRSSDEDVAASLVLLAGAGA
jgi:hypothetical protein